jgi:four helix bundle suffix protein
MQTPGFIPPHGGYKKLLSYQKSEIIYDATIYFTQRFFKPFDRTVDQMVQAARSGKQNIAEASVASGTSKETEIKLTNVARASLEELLIDYQDFLRKNNFIEWDKNHRLALRFRELNKVPGASYQSLQKAIENPDAEICANCIISLIKTATYLLSKQLISLEQNFIKNGGLKESMFKARLNARGK